MGKSISDIIEEFIMSSLDDDEFIELSRNDLAKFFSCVPSQINYVLNTRFTLNRGFVVESQRGGGGYVKVLRVQNNNNKFLENLLKICEQPLTYVEGCQILDHMASKKLLTEREMRLIRVAISEKSLNNPININNKIRSNILQQVIIEALKLNENKEGK